MKQNAEMAERTDQTFGKLSGEKRKIMVRLKESFEKREHLKGLLQKLNAHGLSVHQEIEAL